MQATMRKATIFPSSVCTQPKTFYSNTLPTFPHSESASCRALVDDKRKKSFFRLYGNEKKVLWRNSYKSLRRRRKERLWRGEVSRTLFCCVYTFSGCCVVAKIGSTGGVQLRKRRFCGSSKVYHCEANNCCALHTWLADN